MAYTAHGFHIPGTDKLTIKELGPVPICGGPALCLPCKKEIEVHGMIIGTNDDNVEKAKKIVLDYVNKKHRGEKFTVYVVWFTYILGNWKALVSTTRADSMYYEVTYDSRNKVTYLDPYKKMDNITIPDEEIDVEKILKNLKTD